jgi:hypothetical protein
MRVRRLDINGDYSFGNGEADFWINQPEGVAQKVQTRLLLFLGEWFLDQTVGTPWFQQIIGYNTTANRDVAIRTVILQTNGVVALSNYSSSVGGSGSRNFVVSGLITTVYSKTPVPILVNL